MTRPTEKWAYELATRIVRTVSNALELGRSSTLQEEVPLSTLQEEAIEVWAKHILESCPFMWQWEENTADRSWMLKPPDCLPPYVRQSELNLGTFHSCGTHYDGLDEAKLAAEEELMRGIKKQSFTKGISNDRENQT